MRQRQDKTRQDEDKAEMRQRQGNNKDEAEDKARTRQGDDKAKEEEPLQKTIQRFKLILQTKVPSQGVFGSQDDARRGILPSYW